jgi:hypothetical protein
MWVFGSRDTARSTVFLTVCHVTAGNPMRQTKTDNKNRYVDDHAGFDVF